MGAGCQFSADTRFFLENLRCVFSIVKSARSANQRGHGISAAGEPAQSARPANLQGQRINAPIKSAQPANQCVHRTSAADEQARPANQCSERTSTARELARLANQHGQRSRTNSLASVSALSANQLVPPANQRGQRIGAASESARQRQEGHDLGGQRGVIHLG